MNRGDVVEQDVDILNEKHWEVYPVAGQEVHQRTAEHSHSGVTSVVPNRPNSCIVTKTGSTEASTQRSNKELHRGEGIEREAMESPWAPVRAKRSKTLENK